MANPPENPGAAGGLGCAEPGRVYLVGAGPGDPGLITRRGAELLASADVVVYDGLAKTVLLSLSSPRSERIYAGKKGSSLGAPLGQEQIESLLVDKARQGKSVVRLKGGDPFVFGRAAGECRALSAAGISFEIVPGVTAATGVPAFSGIPLTARNIASTVAIATGHEVAGKAHSVDWSAVARADTVVLFMALGSARECCRGLMDAGRSPTTPAAAIQWGTTASQRTVVSTLGQLADDLDKAELKPPSLLVIGDVVSLRKELGWHETRPLFGARVLVTRPAERSRAFADAIARMGGEPMVAPVTSVCAGSPDQDRVLSAMVSQLGDYRWLVLTSSNAVEYLFRHVQGQGLDARSFANIKIACVGTATAEALLARGLRADLVPAKNNAKAIAEAIVELDGQGLSGAKLLYPRAQDARTDLCELLVAAGAQVDDPVAYGLKIAPAEQPEIRNALARLREGQIQAVGFFAPSQVRALLGLLGSDGKEVLERVPVLAAIGNTTAAEMRALGLTVAVTSPVPDAVALAQKIAAALSSAPRGDHAVP